MALRIAVIGGVAGGSGAAAAARRANESAQIDVFEAGPYISFANCGLPYYLSGEIVSREKLLVTTPDLMKRRFNIDVHVRHAVTSINRKTRTIRVKNLSSYHEFDHQYDRLIIATGAKGFRPPTPGSEHPRLNECRTIDDVDALSAMADKHAKGRALVMGGGFIGVEVAEALVSRGMQVTLIDLAPQILPPLDPEIAVAGLEPFARRGVSLRLGVKVERFEHERDVSHAVLSTGERIAFDFGVMSIGVLPEISLPQEAGLEIGATGGLVVNEQQQTSDPDIFAAGDVTELMYWPTESRMRIALAGPANKQARVAGANAALPPERLRTTGAAGTSIVRVFDLAIGMTGLSEKAAVAKRIPYKVIYTQNGHHAGYFPGAKPLFIKVLFSPETGRVLGGQIFGKEGVDKRIDVLAVAIQAGFTVDQLADVDLAYAPPFGSAKDPIVIAGMVASNAWHGRSMTVTPRELAAELLSGSPPTVVDVRTEAEHAAGRIESAVNLPVDLLRSTGLKFPKDRAVVVHCAVGYRGYVAERMLRQMGFTNVRNLSGGFRAWELNRAAATA